MNLGIMSSGKHPGRTFLFPWFATIQQGLGKKPQF